MPNNDYILRSDAVSTFCGNCEGTEVCGQLGEPCDEVKRIMVIPAAEVAPVRHGRWIAKKKNLTEGAAYMIPLTIRYFVCSLCGREEDNAEPYCNCGAKMDGKADDENTG